MSVAAIALLVTVVHFPPTLACRRQPELSRLTRQREGVTVREPLVTRVGSDTCAFVEPFVGSEPRSRSPGSATTSSLPSVSPRSHTSILRVSDALPGEVPG